MVFPLKLDMFHSYVNVYQRVRWFLDGIVEILGFIHECTMNLQKGRTATYIKNGLLWDGFPGDLQRIPEVPW